MVLESELEHPKNQMGNAHDDWVRDIAWCDNVGSTKDMIASVGEDKSINIWKREHK